jgi:hypothetical protein
MPSGKLSCHDAAREVSRLAAGLYYPSFPASWEEAAVEVVEEDPQLADYEAWEEAALAATVDAFVADVRQYQEVEWQHLEDAWRQRQRWWEVR